MRFLLKSVHYASLSRTDLFTLPCSREVRPRRRVQRTVAHAYQLVSANRARCSQPCQWTPSTMLSAGQGSSAGCPDMMARL
jgi:hypothetical protein